MATRRSMTRDIHESIRLILGKNAKILLKVPVKLELKGKTWFQLYSAVSSCFPGLSFLAQSGFLYDHFSGTVE